MAIVILCTELERGFQTRSDYTPLVHKTLMLGCWFQSILFVNTSNEISKFYLLGAGIERQGGGAEICCYNVKMHLGF